ncbi:hypothetical protein [Paenibacillus sp. 2TAB23]|uniref:hypothetical protein n=1 Tax=Paenibacillus sp. 2TAB23 TaxID=3233004 RepID=UPI003F98FAA4
MTMQSLVSNIYGIYNVNAYKTNMRSIMKPEVLVSTLISIFTVTAVMFFTIKAENNQ